MEKEDSAISLIRETFTNWSEDKASRLAAALAYYTVFSVAPLLIIAIGVAGLVFGRQAVQGQLVGQISGAVGEQTAQLIQAMIQNASRREAGIVATIIGVVTLLLGASGVFGQLQDSLNTIWGVTPKPGRSIWTIVRQRIMPFAMVLGIGLLLLVSVVISAVLSAIGRTLGSAPGVQALTGQAINLAVSYVVITLLFAGIYKVLPEVEIGWEDVWIGAAVTSLLFTIGRFLIGLYLSWSSSGSTYGAAGSLVILLLWVYYSAQILFVGAEFTQVYARRYGSRIRPAEGAVLMTDGMRAEQGLRSSQRRAAAGEDTTVEQNPGETTSLPQSLPTALRSGARLRLSGAALLGIALGLVAGFAQSADRNPPCEN